MRSTRKFTVCVDTLTRMRNVLGQEEPESARPLRNVRIVDAETLETRAASGLGAWKDEREAVHYALERYYEREGLT